MNHNRLTDGTLFMGPDPNTFMGNAQSFVLPVSGEVPDEPPVFTDQRQLLGSTPPLYLPLRLERLKPRREFFGPDELHWQARRGISAYLAMLVLGNPSLQIIGVSDIEAAVRAMEYVGPEPHAAQTAERGGFDKLSPNGLARLRELGVQGLS